MKVLSVKKTVMLLPSMCIAPPLPSTRFAVLLIKLLSLMVIKLSLPLKSSAPPSCSNALLLMKLL